MTTTTGSDNVKRGMAQMQKGGVIMDVVNAQQAKIAEDAGAVAVMDRLATATVLSPMRATCQRGTNSRKAGKAAPSAATGENPLARKK